MPLSNAAIIGLLALIVTIDLAQFRLQLKQAKEITKIQAKQGNDS